MDAPIKMWRWEDAPMSLKQYSTHGGDEDWVVLANYRSEDMYLVDHLVDKLAHGDYCEELIELDKKLYKIYITAHA